MRIRRGTVLLSFILTLILFITVVNHWSTLKPQVVWAIDSIHKAQSENPSALSHLEAKAVVLMDENTGEVLYSRREEQRLYPASTTKIMTAWIAIEKGKLTDRITVGDEVQLRTPEESSAGLIEGQVLILKDLLAALMLPSGNDAARTIARYITQKESGKELGAEASEGYFAKLMNQKAEKAGAKRTHFVNPHGLHDPNHYTTAKDMAIIGLNAMKNDTFRQIVNKQRITTKSAQTSQTYVNRNLLIKKDSPFFFQGANGIKSGFTDQAGYCLVSSATRNGKEVLSVVLDSSQDGVWTDSQSLLEFGLEDLIR